MSRPGRGSWADTVLRLLGYDKDPARLQHIISTVFSEATSKIEVPGVRVVAFPLYSVMNGTCDEVVLVLRDDWGDWASLMLGWGWWAWRVLTRYHCVC